MSSSFIALNRAELNKRARRYGKDDIIHQPSYWIERLTKKGYLKAVKVIEKLRPQGSLDDYIELEKTEELYGYYPVLYLSWPIRPPVTIQQWIRSRLLVKDLFLHIDDGSSATFAGLDIDQIQAILPPTLKGNKRGTVRGTLGEVIGQYPFKYDDSRKYRITIRFEDGDRFENIINAREALAIIIQVIMYSDLTYFHQKEVEYTVNDVTEWYDMDQLEYERRELSNLAGVRVPISTAAPSYMNFIPNEILTQIASNLRPAHIISLANTNSENRQLSRDRQYWIHRLNTTGSQVLIPFIDLPGTTRQLEKLIDLYTRYRLPLITDIHSRTIKHPIPTPTTLTELIRDIRFANSIYTSFIEDGCTHDFSRIKGSLLRDADSNAIITSANGTIVEDSYYRGYLHYDEVFHEFSLDLNFDYDPSEEPMLFISFWSYWEVLRLAIVILENTDPKDDELVSDTQGEDYIERIKNRYTKLRKMYNGLRSTNKE